MPKPDLRVLIGGGGIAGLTVANLLRHAGKHFNFKVTLLESYAITAPAGDVADTVASERSIGGGIGLWPPSQTVLEQLPQYSSFINAHGFIMPSPSYRDAAGRVLARGNDNFEQRFPVQCIDRTQLTSMLASGITTPDDDNIKIIEHARIKDYAREGNEIVLNTEDGRSFRGDVLIACDGIHSRIRNTLMSELSLPDIHPTKLGYTYFRANVSLPVNGPIKWWSAAFETWAEVHGGCALRFGYVPLQPPHAFWFIAIKTDPSHPLLAPTSNVTLVDQPTKLFLQKLVQDWQPVLHDNGDVVVDYTDLLNRTEEILRTDIAKVDNITMFPWTSMDNKVILIGDAAHATAPNIAQGAGLSIEDAAAVVNLLDSEDYITALNAFEATRKQRAKVVQAYADSIALVGQLDSTLLQQARNSLMRIATTAFPRLQRWTFERAVSHSLGGSNRYPFWQAPTVNVNANTAPKHQLFSTILPAATAAATGTSLAPSVVAFKTSSTGGSGQGTVTVTHGERLASSIIAKLLCLPRPMQSQPFYATVVNLSPTRQQWTRVFAHRTPMQATYATTHDIYYDRQQQQQQQQQPGFFLSEGIGGWFDNTLRFLYQIEPQADGSLKYTSHGMTFFDLFKLPLPPFMTPTSQWVESPTTSGWTFNGVIALPLFGPLMKYSGNFEVDSPLASPIKNNDNNENNNRNNNDNKASNREKRLIIAGGTGMIGKAVCEVFLRQGYTVFCLTRDMKQKQQQGRNIPLDGVKLLSLTADWSAFITKDTVIVNLAGSNPGARRWSTAVKKEILDSRVKIIDTICSNINNATQTPRIFLQASAAGYYGDHKDALLTEESQPNIGTEDGTRFRVEVCKVLEQHATAAVDTGAASATGRCAVINLRIGHVLANTGGIFPYLKLASYCGACRLGSGSQYVPFVHIDDVARAIVFIADQESKENQITHGSAVNIAAPVSCSNKELLQILHQKRSQWLPRFPIPLPLPRWLLKILIGESVVILTDSERVYPARLLGAGFRFNYDTIEKAISGLQ